MTAAKSPLPERRGYQAARMRLRSITSPRGWMMSASSRLLSKDRRVDKLGTTLSDWDVFRRAGWDPFDPSSECLEATHPPRMHPSLTEMDRLGILHQYIFIRAFSRFGRGTSYKGEQAEEVMLLATCLALRRTDLLEDLTIELAQEWSNKIFEWRRDVLHPAWSRMESAPAGLETNPAAYEPATTLVLVLAEMGLVDQERDRSLMALGQAMHEEGRKRPKHHVPTSSEESQSLHELLTSGGEALSRITDSGMIEIDPLQVKKALDKLDPERRQVIRQERREAENYHREALAQGQMGNRKWWAGPIPDPVVSELVSKESSDALDLVLRVRTARAKPRTARWHVLKNFARIAPRRSRDVSIRLLSEEVRMDESTLREALADELRAIRRALKIA